MNYLTLENVSKTYGEKVLFDHISLQISKGQKIALVAKNGSGKSTLLRVIAGHEAPEGEASKIIMRRDSKIGYLEQEPFFLESHSIIEAVLDSDNPIIQAIRAYEEALLFSENEAEMQTALAKMDDLKAWDMEAKIKEVLSKFSFSNMAQYVSNLSGGQRKRLALAKLIIDDPEFIILDEPTNHLDIDMIEWLEEYLSQANMTILMVTHDRYFLERICNQIIELDQGELIKYSGNYKDYLEKKASRQETQGVELDKSKKLLKKELDWVNRSPSARGTKAKSRVDAYYDLDEKLSGKQIEKEIQIEIKGQRLGKKILELHNVGKRFGDVPIVEGFSYKFQKHERIGILGSNGVGKSTFLKLITEEIRPDSGKVVVGGNTVFGYYTQDGIQLKDDKRVIEVIQDIAEFVPMEKGQKITAPQMLERFLFSRKQQQVYVSQLSGGERRRLYLLTLLMKNPNFLILDEPTNDLDILTLNILEEFLLDFPGCVIIVSHDRYFMDKLVDHVFIFEGNGQIRDFMGDYTEYRKEVKEREREQRRTERAEQQKQVAEQPQQIQRQRSQEERKEMNRLEKEMAKLESRKAEIMALFNESDIALGEIEKLSKELGILTETLEEKEMRWLELAE